MARSSLLNNQDQIADLGTEKIETTAGSFSTNHIQKTGASASEIPSDKYIFSHQITFKKDMWLNKSVCTGVIKGQEWTETGTIVSSVDQSTPVQDRGQRLPEAEYVQQRPETTTLYGVVQP